MVWSECQGAVEVAAEIGAEFLRKAENEIERDSVNAGPAERVECAGHRVHVVGAVHPFEDRGMKRLCAQGDAVYTGLPPGLGAGGGDIVRVCFEGHLHPRLCPLSRNGRGGRQQTSDQRDQVLRRKEGRRAAAEVERVQWLVVPLTLLSSQAQLFEDRPGVALAGDSPPHRDGEVAVTAPAGAEGDVDIDVAHVRNKAGRVRTREEGRGRQSFLAVTLPAADAPAPTDSPY